MPQPSPSTDPRFQVRVYHKDSTDYQVIPLDSLQKANARIKADAGYGQALVNLLGVRSGFPLVRTGAIIEMVYLWAFPDGSGYTELLLYRGLIARVVAGRMVESGKPLRAVRLTCHGLWSFLRNLEGDKKYAPPTDKGTIFRDLARRIIISERPGIVVRADAIDDKVAGFDTRDKTFSTILSELSQETGRIVYGCDTATATGGNLFRPDRVFFNNVDAPDVVTHTLLVPSNQVGSRSKDDDATSQITHLRIKGGQDPYPNLLATVTDDNTNFSNPSVSGEERGNRLKNPSLEKVKVLFTDALLPYWSKTNSVQLVGNNPDTGNSAVLLADPGARIWQEQKTDEDGLIAGNVYAFDLRSRRQENGASTAEARVYWYDADEEFLPYQDEDGNTHPFYSQLIDPVGANYEDFSVQATVPGGAVGWRVEVENEDGVGDGLLIDTTGFYDASAIGQFPWTLTPHGDAKIVEVDWVYTGKTFAGSAYALRVKVEAQDDAGQDVTLRVASDARIEATGNQPLRLDAWIASVAPGVPVPKTRIEIEQYKADGTQTESSNEPYEPAIYDNFTPISVERTTHEDTAGVECELNIRSSGEFLIGGLQLVEAGAPSNTFRVGTQFDKTYRAADLFAGDTTPTGQKILAEALELEAAHGKLSETEEKSEINNDELGTEYAKAAFTQRTLPIRRPQVETFGVFETGAGLTNAHFWPGQNVRVVGSDAESVLDTDDVLPIWEVEINWDGKLTITPYFEDEKDDRAKALRKLVEAVNKRTSSGTNSSSRSSGSSVVVSGGGGTGTGTGAPGAAATITVGDTVTGDPNTDAQVFNSGTTSAAVLEFVIPRGADGEDGEDGEDGDAGAPGTVWYTGAAVPAAGTGISGDYYLRTNGEVYHKVGASWGSVIANLSGPPGQNATLSFDPQSANTFWAGPVSGSAAAPVFRTFVTDDLPNLSVTAAKLATSAVSTTKIADGAVTTIKLSDGSITAAKIGAGEVTGIKLENSGVTAGTYTVGTFSVTVDAKGRVTSITSGSVAIPAETNAVKVRTISGTPTATILATNEFILVNCASQSETVDPIPGP